MITEQNVPSDFIFKVQFYNDKLLKPLLRSIVDAPFEDKSRHRRPSLEQKKTLLGPGGQFSEHQQQQQSRGILPDPVATTRVGNHMSYKL